MSEAPRHVDPYLIPGSACLRNLVGATDPKELEAVEARLAILNAPAAMERVRHGRPWSLNDLREVHRALFKDVYDWAGDVRTIDLARKDDQFCPPGLLDGAAAKRFKELNEDFGAPGLPFPQAVERFAHHFQRLNELHPFREGNGRTQRIFFSEVAKRAGFSIDWERATGGKERMHALAHEAYLGNSGQPFYDLFLQILTPRKPLAQVKDVTKVLSAPHAVEQER